MTNPLQSVPPCGPPDADIMIVGEAPGDMELHKNEPFVGAAGAELSKMLHEAGIARSECFITNVCRSRPPGNEISLLIAKSKKEISPLHKQLNGKWVLPPVADGYDQLLKEIELVKPKVIIALGNLPLWALTKEWGVTDWRGSTLFFNSIPVIPTYHPSAILRNWAWRAIAVNDFRRVARVLRDGVKMPHYSFIIEPDYPTVIRTITHLIHLAMTKPLKLAVDIETRSGHITCIGFAWSKLEALCIPLWTTDTSKPHYWLEGEEVEIVYYLNRLLCHPNVQVIGQNWIYDTQYILRHFGFIPNFHFDTMLAQHVAFAGMPKSLDFLASMYAEFYRYWKNDVKHNHTKVEA